jgi:palmitoyl-protein thioesterase
LLVVAIVVSIAHIFAVAGSPPVVLWHGMGDSCCNPLSLGKIIKLIEHELTPAPYVHSIRIGSNAEEDTVNGYFMNANHQIDYACKLLNADKNLTQGYHAIGFSQGGQFLRAIAQRCPTPPMLNLISIGGQHQGVFGFPKCPGDNETICNYIRELLRFGVYETFVQDHLVQAEYWQDPHKEAEYRRVSVFLADINQERTFNEQYKTNLLKIRNLVLVEFLGDTVVIPRESEHFGFYAENDTSKILPLQETPLYTKDLLGLKIMDQQSRIKFLQTDGDHLRFTDQWFIDNIIPLLKD